MILANRTYNHGILIILRKDVAMKVIKVSEAKTEEATSALFEGKVTRRDLIGKEQSRTFQVGLVTFNPGARNLLHSHDTDQVLYVTEGKGIVATKEKEQIVTAGTIIFFPAGELHWHGAVPDSSFSHITVTVPGVKTSF